MKSGRARRLWRALGIVTLTAAVTVVVGVTTVALGPSIWIAANSSVAERNTSVTLVSDDLRATIDVPSGWLMRPGFADVSTYTVSSPDGVMRVDFGLEAAGDVDIAVRTVSPGVFPALDVEQTGPDLALVHARTDDGAAVVGALSAPAGIVTFVAHAPVAYDAELSRLLSTIAVEG